MGRARQQSLMADLILLYDVLADSLASIVAKPPTRWLMECLLSFRTMISLVLVSFMWFKASKARPLISDASPITATA
jgi:hypothetical protein